MKSLTITFRAALAATLCAACGNAWTAGISEASLGLIPRPSSVQIRDGHWALKPAARIVAREPAAAESAKLADALSLTFGKSLPVVSEYPS